MLEVLKAKHNTDTLSQADIDKAKSAPEMTEAERRRIEEEEEEEDGQNQMGMS